jgi:hypothetical protein
VRTASTVLRSQFFLMSTISGFRLVVVHHNNRSMRRAPECRAPATEGEALPAYPWHRCGFVPSFQAPMSGLPIRFASVEQTRDTSAFPLRSDERTVRG